MMSEVASAGRPPRLTLIQWLVCAIASIGFAFDIYELLMLPLVVRPALQEMIGAAPGSPQFGAWVGRLFFFPAFAGGIFGLLGGWLTDRFGRRRVLTYSILLYAVSAFLAGFSTNPWMLLVLRCTTFVGVCVEFVAAVAWLAELFPDPEQREKVIGYTQAFSSIGGLLVALANWFCVRHALSLPAIHLPEAINFFGGSIQDPHAPWRYTLMSGLLPALPLIVIRPFLPESPVWREKKLAGTLRRPSVRQLWSPALARTTLVTTLMFAMAYGAAFGALQHVQRIVPGLAEVKAHAEEAGQLAAAQTEGDEAAKQKAAVLASRRAVQDVAAQVTKVQELGGLFGRVLMAALAVALVARGHVSLRSLLGWGALVGVLLFEAAGEFGGGWIDHLTRLGLGLPAGVLFGLVAFALARGAQRVFKPSVGTLIRLFLLPGLIVIPLVFAVAAVHSLSWLYVGIFFAGLLTIGQFSFWGNYLPRVYPVHLRGTGESFAANIGGRMIGTSFAWLTSTVAVQPWVPGGSPEVKLAYTAAAVGFIVYLLGGIASWWLPEPARDTLPD